jgi:hypothetical protein
MANTIEDLLQEISLLEHQKMVYEAKLDKQAAKIVKEMINDRQSRIERLTEVK